MMGPTILPSLILALTAIGSLIVVGLLIVDWRKNKPPPATGFHTAVPSQPPIPPRPTTTRLRATLWIAALRDLTAKLRSAVRAHPVAAWGWAETAFWLLMLPPLLDHLLDPRNSRTAFAAWALTIGPHEIGHVICIPFGQFISIAGGSVWQLLWWFGLGAVVLVLRRQLTAALVMGLVGGHSFINLAQYIGDARAKQLPLLFGLGAEHHDWSNLLGMLGLLEWDTVLATLSTLLGAVCVLACIALGVLTAWFLPRTRLGNAPRYVGNPLRALAAAIRATGSAPGAFTDAGG